MRGAHNKDVQTDPNAFCSSGTVVKNKKIGLLSRCTYAAIETARK